MFFLSINDFVNTYIKKKIKTIQDINVSKILLIRASVCMCPLLGQRKSISRDAYRLT